MSKKRNRLPEEQTINICKFVPKNKKQEELVNSIRDNEITVAIGSSGTGKTFCSVATALDLLNEGYKRIILVKSVTTIPGEEIGFTPGPQPLYSQIATPKGWVSMGDLRVGDEVIARDGFPSKILKIYKKGTKEVYKITLSDGRETYACGEHIWATENSKKQVTKLVTTRSMFENLDTKKFYLPINGIVQYDRIDVPIDPYLVGVLLGDGIISGSHIRFCSNDEEIVESVKDILIPYNLDVHKSTEDGIIYTISAGRKNTQSGAREMSRKNLFTREVEILGYLKEATSKLNVKDTTLIGRCTRNSIVDGYQYFFTGNISKSANVIKQHLIELDLYGKKANEKSIPKLYKYAHADDRIKLLQGMLDTDGSIKEGGKDVTYYTSSEKMADDIVELVYSLGGTARKYFRDRIGRTNTLENGQVIETKQISYEVYINFYNDIFNPFKLIRKANRFVPKLNYHYATRVSKIESIGKDVVQCIKIENPEHLYLTDNFIVTHNSADEKMLPFMMSYSGNIDKLLGKDSYKDLLHKGLIEVLPIAYIRGLSIDDSIVIFDEAQNTTPHTFKTIITRIGTNSKYIILGDIEQVDRRNKKESCLASVVEIFRGSDCVGTIEFTDEDCVRNPIIPKILQKLREHNI